MFTNTVINNLTKHDMSRHLEVAQIPSFRNISNFDASLPFPDNHPELSFSLDKGKSGDESTALSYTITNETALPPAPLYTEKHTTLTTTVCEEMICSWLTALFVTQGVDYKHCQEAHKFKVVTRDENGLCILRVYMFAGKSKGEILVEFQRRQGSRSAFAQLFALFAEHSGRPRRQSGQETGRLPVELDKESYLLILQGVNSQYYESQREGLLSLSSYASNAENRRIVLQVSTPMELTEMCKAGLQSPDNELCNYASRLLLELSQESVMVDVLVAMVVVGNEAAKLLSEPPHYLTADTKRCLAATVLNLAHIAPGKFRGSKVMAALARHANSPQDLKLQQSALDALNLISPGNYREMTCKKTDK